MWGSRGTSRSGCSRSTSSARPRCWPRPASAAAIPGCWSPARPRSTAPSPTPARLPLTEESATAPLTPYAASKLAAEALIAQAWLGHGQHVITVRPFNHIGPGQTPNFAVPALAKRIVEADARGAPTIPVGNLSARRDFTDVRDVVRAYRLLDRVGPGRRGLQRVLRVATCRSARSPTACWPWPAPRSSSRPTRRWSGRWRSRCCGATRAGWSGHRVEAGGSPWTRPWPTSWPTGASSG